MESKVGEGSTFHFTTRFGPGAEVKTNTRTTLPPGLLGMPVLVVDDNATNRRILTDILTNWRMRPVAVESGAAALKALQHGVATREPFTLVLLDCMMPGMDGFGLAEHMRTNPEFARATIMMLTSGNQQGGLARCKELGIAAHLTKPILQAELLRAIKSALRISVEIAPPVPARSAETVSERSLHILLAEDNAINQKIALRLLEKAGHQVRVAVNGKEALSALEQQPFDVVLMDVQMPEMGGFEATGILREREKGTGRHMPVIAMTAHAMKGDRERCLEAGMDDYVSKPVQTAELLRVLAPYAATASSEQQPFCRETALDGMCGDEQLLTEIIAIFLADAPILLKEARLAIARGDASKLHRTTHTLKGAVSYLGAGPAVEAVQKLETIGASGNLKGALESFHVMEQEVDRLREALVATTQLCC